MPPRYANTRLSRAGTSLPPVAEEGGHGAAYPLPPQLGLRLPPLVPSPASSPLPYGASLAGGGASSPWNPSPPPRPASRGGAASPIFSPPPMSPPPLPIVITEEEEDGDDAYGTHLTGAAAAAYAAGGRQTAAALSLAEVLPMSPTRKLRVVVAAGTLEGLRPHDVARVVAVAYDAPLRVLRSTGGAETWTFEAKTISAAQSLAAATSMEQFSVRGRAKVMFEAVEEYVPPPQPTAAQRLLKGLSGFGTSLLSLPAQLFPSGAGTDTIPLTEEEIVRRAKAAVDAKMAAAAARPKSTLAMVLSPTRPAPKLEPTPTPTSAFAPPPAFAPTPASAAPAPAPEPGPAWNGPPLQASPFSPASPPATLSPQPFVSPLPLPSQPPQLPLPPTPSVAPPRTPADAPPEPQQSRASDAAPRSGGLRGWFGARSPVIAPQPVSEPAPAPSTPRSPSPTPCSAMPPSALRQSPNSRSMHRNITTDETKRHAELSRLVKELGPVAPAYQGALKAYSSRLDIAAVADGSVVINAPQSRIDLLAVAAGRPRSFGPGSAAATAAALHSVLGTEGRPARGGPLAGAVAKRVVEHHLKRVATAAALAAERAAQPPTAAEAKAMLASARLQRQSTIGSMRNLASFDDASSARNGGVSAEGSLELPASLPSSGPARAASFKAKPKTKSFVRGESVDGTQIVHVYGEEEEEDGDDAAVAAVSPAKSSPKGMRAAAAAPRQGGRRTFLSMFAEAAQSTRHTILTLGMPPEYVRKRSEAPPVPLHEHEDSIWDWHRYTRHIEAPPGDREQLHVSSATASRHSGDAAHDSQQYSAAVAYRRARQAAEVDALQGKEGAFNDYEDEPSAFAEIAEELRLHAVAKVKGDRELVEPLDQRPWDRRKIALLGNASPLSFLGSVMALLAFVLGVIASTAPWVSYDILFRNTVWGYLETTNTQQFIDRTVTCISTNPHGVDPTAVTEGCTTVPLQVWWQRDMLLALQVAVGTNFLGIIFCFLSQRHLRWWIAEFQSPWAKIPIIVGGITGDCGHEPHCSRSLATRDCGYICTPAFSGALTMLSGVIYLGIFGRFIQGTTNTYEQNYRAGGGWLSLVAGGLAISAGLYIFWAQWVACPVEHVWHCDCHANWAQIAEDMEERRVMATPHAEPHQGLPQLIATVHAMTTGFVADVLVPLGALIYPVATRAAALARMLATVAPRRRAGPSDAPPKWLAEHEQRILAEAEASRSEKKRQAAFASPFKSLRRSFIIKPQLQGRGVAGPTAAQRASSFAAASDRAASAAAAGERAAAALAAT